MLKKCERNNNADLFAIHLITMCLIEREDKVREKDGAYFKKYSLFLLILSNLFLKVPHVLVFSNITETLKQVYSQSTAYIFG